MARKITVKAIEAFMSTRQFFCDNTSVTIENDKVLLKLHNNLIARREVGSNTIQITSSGYFTATTKERLNGIPGVSICQKKGVWYLNGKDWDGSWIEVK